MTSLYRTDAGFRRSKNGFKKQKQVNRIIRLKEKILWGFLGSFPLGGFYAPKKGVNNSVKNTQTSQK